MVATAAPDPLRSLNPAVEARARSLGPIRTPALVVDAATVEANIDNAIRLIGSPHRWRAHCKTVKSEWAMRTLVDRGVRRFKASTVIEVESLLRAGAADVLYAVPTVGPDQAELLRLADEYPEARVSALLDSLPALGSWAPGRLGYFLDVNTGMNRTGLPADDPAEAHRLARAATQRGFPLRGLHHYDGHLAGLPGGDRDELVHSGLDRLARFAAAFAGEATEIVTGGSHTFLPALDHDFPGGIGELVTVSPGTIVYCDLRSLERLGDIGFRPAVGVLCRVLSAPAATDVTVNAGLTSLQVDAGIPHAAVSGTVDVTIGSPSQEHLGIRYPTATSRPAVGDLLVLVPRHVDTTIAQFDWFLLIHPDGQAQRHPVSARHHGAPCLGHL